MEDLTEMYSEWFEAWHSHRVSLAPDIFQKCSVPTCCLAEGHLYACVPHATFKEYNDGHWYIFAYARRKFYLQRFYETRQRILNGSLH